MTTESSPFEFKQLPKLQPGDQVAILSPSFVAPAFFPHVHELGLQRLRDIFGLHPVEYPSTRNREATHAEKARDLIDAFSNPEIKAVIATIGGDDQIEWVRHLPSEPFRANPKPFFGYSDNTHIAHHLWQNGIPSYYGGSLFVQFARQCEMDPLTIQYLQRALFDSGVFELEQSKEYNDEDLPWEDPSILQQKRRYQPCQAWQWDTGTGHTTGHEVQGITWGGCLESIDELLRHHITLPSLSQCEQIILCLETSEELPPAAYVARVLRALGGLGILERIQGLFVGRAKAWSFEQPNRDAEKVLYQEEQQKVIIEMVRRYNPSAPIVQNMDFGHTDPQICLPLGHLATINMREQKISIQF